MLHSTAPEYETVVAVFVLTNHSHTGTLGNPVVPAGGGEMELLCVDVPDHASFDLPKALYRGHGHDLGGFDQQATHVCN